MMNVEFDTKLEQDGTYTVVITFSNVPDEQQAQAAGNLVKRALLDQGGVGIVGHNPFDKLPKRRPKQ
jgi:hypothetical protein